MNGRDMMNPTQLPWARFAFLGLLLAGLGACGGSGSGASAIPPSAGPSTTPASLPSTPASAPSAQAWGGHFIGTVTIGDVDYYGDALLTSDGAIRVYVGGPYAVLSERAFRLYWQWHIGTPFGRGIRYI